MALGSNKGRWDKEGAAAPLAEINTTPLVDVMLVLLVIFLVTAPMLTQAVKLELPAETATQIADEHPVTLSVNSAGEYFWEKNRVTLEELEQQLIETAVKNKKTPLHLRADKTTAYGKVSKILSLAQKHGLTQIGFVTQPPAP